MKPQTQTIHLINIYIYKLLNKDQFKKIVIKLDIIFKIKKK